MCRSRPGPLLSSVMPIERSRGPSAKQSLAHCHRGTVRRHNVHLDRNCEAVKDSPLVENFKEQDEVRVLILIPGYTTFPPSRVIPINWRMLAHRGAARCAMVTGEVASR